MSIVTGAGVLEAETYTSQGIVADVRRGLLDNPKWLSSLYFYDEFGSQLFDQICDTPEYYPTRTEQRILEDNSDDILQAAGTDLLLAEMGSGSSTKTRVLLKALLAHQGPSQYMPIDVSSDFLQNVAAQLEADFEGLKVEPIADEYHAGIARVGSAKAARRLVLFLGSSIGNFEPEEQVALLRAAHDNLAPGDTFLLGTDLVKPEAVLNAAYNDSAGVTAAFNKNILTHIARELNGTVELENFEHVAFWNAEKSRIEMHLKSLCEQKLSLPKAKLEVPLATGEMIHTENSYKFTPQRVQEMVTAAGWQLERTWLDDNSWFGLHLLRRN